MKDKIHNIWYLYNDLNDIMIPPGVSAYKSGIKSDTNHDYTDKPGY